MLAVRDHGVGRVGWFGGFELLLVVGDLWFRWLVETSAASLPSSACGMLSVRVSGFSVQLRIRRPVV